MTHDKETDSESLRSSGQAALILVKLMDLLGFVAERDAHAARAPSPIDEERPWTVAESRGPG